MITLSVDHLYRAQFGEDRILWQVFRKRPTGYFIEVGAYDGVTLSNTCFLEQMGWSGVLLEPIPALAQKAAQARGRSRVVCAAASKAGSCGTAKFTVAQNVPVLSFLTADQAHVDRCKREGAQLIEIDVSLTTVNEVLERERTQAPAGLGPWSEEGGWSIDLVSIDTEGSELDVLDGFGLDRYRPRVLLMENDRESGDTIEPYLTQRGYRKFHRQKINDFYVRNDADDGSLLLHGFDVPTW